MYTLFMPNDRLVIQATSFRSSSFAKRLPARCSIIFETGKSPTVPGPDCTEHARRCPNGIAHAARLVSTGQYAHVRCCTIPCESLPPRQDDLRSHRPAEKYNTSHLTVGGILNRHSHGHSYLCTCHVTKSHIQLHEATFQHHNDWLQQNRCVNCTCKGSLTK